MTPIVEIKLDEGKLRRVQKMLADVPRQIPGVISRAINRTAGTIKTEAARRVAEETPLKVSAVKKRIQVKKATQKRWWAKIHFSRGPLPLVYFSARKSKKGVTYQLTRGQKLLAPKAFRIKSEKKTGNKQTVFKRGGAATGKSRVVASIKGGGREFQYEPTAKRLPIVALYGPSIGEAFEKIGQLKSQLKTDANKTLIKNIDSQIDFVLKRARTG